MGYAISHFRCKEKLEFIFPFIESIFVVIQVTDGDLSGPQDTGIYSGPGIALVGGWLCAS